MNIFDNNQLKDEFNKYYPDIKINELDHELLSDMMLNIAFEMSSKNIPKDNQVNKNNKKSIIQLNPDLESDNESEDKSNNLDKEEVDELILQNYLLANELIPEMFVPSDLIHLKGRLNGVPINIIVDSGAQGSVSFKSVIDRAGLDYLVDKKSTHYTIGVNDIKKSYGMIWYIDLELEIKNNQYASIPIALDITDDTNIKIKEQDLKIKTSNPNPMDMLLGINFLKAYKANINFSKRTITLNDSITINYK